MYVTNLHLNADEILSVNDPLLSEASGPLIRFSDEFPHVLLEGSIFWSTFKHVLYFGEGFEGSGQRQVVTFLLQVACQAGEEKNLEVNYGSPVQICPMSILQ